MALSTNSIFAISVEPQLNQARLPQDHQQTKWNDPLEMMKIRIKNPFSSELKGLSLYGTWLERRDLTN